MGQISLVDYGFPGVVRGRIEHMFESLAADAVQIRGLCAALVTEPGAGAGNAERIDRIRALEELKSAAAAAQAQLAAEFDADTRATLAARGVPVAEQSRGIGHQLALARRESPFRGNQLLGLAKALVHEMPHTFTALSEGRLSEWRASILVRETACLTLEDRRAVDVRLCADPATLAGVGHRGIADRARALAAKLDAASVVRRRRKAESERRVSVRPAPDTMGWVSLLARVGDAVAVHVTLGRAADAARAAGDPRTRDQLMADLLVARVTGRDPHTGQGPAVRLGLVMTDRALLAGDDHPAHLDGYGTITAEHARDLLAQAQDVWLRRLYTHPSTGELIAMDASSRVFPDRLKTFLTLRDRTCRTPWCDAPIRHTDHAIRVADGGATSADNGQGLCAACNYAKEAHGWQTAPAPDSTTGHHRIQTATPTGHTYTSRPPPMPGAA